MPDSPIPYCGPPPTPADLLAAWNGDPALLAALALAAFAGEWHLRRTRAEARLHRLHWLAMATLVLAFVSPLCALSAALFSGRVAHHLLLIAVAAPLVAMAFPQARAPRFLAPLALLHVVLVWVWHAPAPYAAAMASDAVYWVMELTLIGSGVVLWRGLLAPGSPLARVLLVHLGIVAQMGLLGALITFAPRPLYAPHFLSTEPFGLSALEDQQLAGLLMWVPAAIPYVAAALLALAAHLKREEHAA